MISREQALVFAHEWIASWNTHNLERVLSHYTDDFSMSSPIIISMGVNPSGTLSGKANVAAYWSKALVKYPDLHFELLEVLSCVDTIIIYYISINGKKAAEYFMLNEEGKVYKAAGHYN